ncbi:unnamed protein product [Caenorhabditis brenneri]
MRTHLIVFVFLLGAAAHWHDDGTDFSTDEWKPNQEKILSVEDTGKELVARLDKVLRAYDLELLRAHFTKDCVWNYCGETHHATSCANLIVDLPMHYKFTFNVNKTIDTGDEFMILVHVTAKYYDDAPKTYALELTYNKNVQKFSYLRYPTCP